MNLEEAAKAVEQIKNIVKSTFDRGVLLEVGSFAAVYDPFFLSYKRPVLVTSTDGIGTKIILHLKAKTFDEAGQDLVAMCANDILTLGAKPLFFLDYIAGGKIDSQTVVLLVNGIAKALKKIGCALIGGETAEMPDVYKEGDYDLSGFIVGIAEKEKLPSLDSVKPGDILIGIESSGPHSNGYSLVRKVMDENSLSLDTSAFEGKTFGELVLAPTNLYHPAVLPLFEKKLVKSAAHITGGGFFENIPRALPKSVNAVIRKSSFPIPEIFKILMKYGNIEEEEMFHVFNMGIGFTLVASPENEKAIHQVIKEAGFNSYTIGEIISGEGQVKIVE